MNQNNNNSVAEEDYKVVLGFVKDFFKTKRFILLSVVLFSIFGVIYILSAPKVYSSGVTFITRSGSSAKNSGGLGGIASFLSGGRISAGATNSSDIPVYLYPKIMSSLPFQQKLYQTPLKLKGVDTLVTFGDYALHIERPSFKTTLAKYTIGLPKLIFGSKSSNGETSSKRPLDSLLYESGDEKKIIKSLSSKVSLIINEEDGTLHIRASMEDEAIAATQLAQSAQRILQEEVIRYRVSQAQDKYDFINEQYQLRKEDFEKSQAKLANYSDRNLFNTTQSSLIRKQQLESESSLLFAIYSDLEQQRLAQSIKIQEDTPTFTTLSPALVPLHKVYTNPFKTLFIFVLLGFFVAILRYIFVVGWRYVKHLWSSI